MADSAADIVNIALARIGVKKRIADLSESSTEAREANVVYEHVRDTLLAAAQWSFAKKQVELAALADVERAGWSYAFSAPDDMVSPRYIDTGIRPGATSVRYPFEVQANDDLTGRIILCDLQEATLVYTGKVTSEPAFPPLFVDAFAWMLAEELVLSLPVKPNVATLAFKRAEVARSRAIAQTDRKSVV